MYEYKAIVDRWIDGDTVDLKVDLGFYMTAAIRFRLTGIDTPERGRPGAKEAHELASSMAPAGATVWVMTDKADKYGRWLANVFVTPMGRTVNQALLDAGLAKLYFGGTKDAS
jgi:micrococcal nuclease